MYNYREEVKKDVLDFIATDVDFTDFESLENLERYLNDVCWYEDSITGNASGSYTFSSYQAQENLVGNLDLLKEALEMFGDSLEYLENGPEACDVTIRCYLLGEVISEALEEVKTDYEKAVESLKQKVFDKYVLSMENNGEPEEEIWNMIENATNQDMRNYLEMD